MPTLTETAQHISTEILELATAIEAEAATQPKGPTDIAVAQQRRDALKDRLGKMRVTATAFDTALNKLQLPPPELMVWAQSILDLDNAAILEIDTTSTAYDADVIRVLLLSVSGDVLFDRILRNASGESNQHHTGIAPDTLAQAQPIADTWPAVIAELRKYYLVAFGMVFDVDRLANQNTRLGAPPYRLFTEDLQPNLTQYFRSDYYTKLETVAAKVGCMLPEKPQRDALDRARATLAILKAVAEGFIKSTETTTGEEFPF
jgi:hypothetical protein